MSWRRNYAKGRRKQLSTKRGRVVRSRLEAKVLDALDADGVDYQYEPRTVRWSERIVGAKCDECGSKRVSKSRRYLPDIILGNGIVLEVKGRFTTRDRKLIMGVRETNPEMDIRMVFDRDNKLSAGATSRYSEWCAKRDIKCCFKGSVPPHWIKEDGKKES